MVTHFKTAKKFCSGFLFKKTGLRIDQPTPQGGTSSTGNIARQCFSKYSDFNIWVFHLQYTVVYLGHS